MSRHRNMSSTLYVRNISDRVRYDDVRRLFQKYGKIVDITIPLDYYTRYPKGFCFVEYEDSKDAEEAQYRLDRQLLFGREIEVEFARGDRKSAGEMRTRDRDRRHHRGGGGGGGSGRYNSNYHDRYEPRRRSRTRSRSPKRSSRRSRTREMSGSRSKSRTPRSRSSSPRSNHNHKSVSRERSRSPVNRSMSPPAQRGGQKSASGSPQQHRRSGKPMEADRSRSGSPS